MGWAARLNTTPRTGPGRTRPLSEKAQRDAARLAIPAADWLRALFAPTPPRPAAPRDRPITRVPDDEAA
jgi:hypothetical protein